MIADKEKRLREYLQSLGRAAVAFSAGVDSTYLLSVAHEVLGDDAIAVTVISPLLPHEETDEAKEICRSLGVKHVTVDVNPLANADFCANPVNRCYVCKRFMMAQLVSAAERAGFQTVLEGTNADDAGDYRPGEQAVHELGLLSPLKEAGLTKSEIRELSRQRGLPTWDKPSYSCLATRIQYGQEITRDRLSVTERAERFLHNLGFSQVRVRMHGDIARIEGLKSDIRRMCDLSDEISRELHSIGYRYVCIDTDGYRTGSMNSQITE